jgi:hypothetical protein
LAVNLLKQSRGEIRLALVEANVPGIGDLDAVAALRSVEPSLLCYLLEDDLFDSGSDRLLGLAQLAGTLRNILRH